MGQTDFFENLEQISDILINMKKIVMFAAALLLSIGIVAQASPLPQDGPPPPPPPPAHHHHHHHHRQPPPPPPPPQQ
jgi:hypothetical protein